MPVHGRILNREGTDIGEISVVAAKSFEILAYILWTYEDIASVTGNKTHLVLLYTEFRLWTSC
jgi:hypothetical protein